MMVENIGNVYLSNSTFMSNYAYESGGAIYFKCDAQTATGCYLNIDNATKFIQNYAELEGGAIKWNFFEPDIQYNESMF